MILLDGSRRSDLVRPSTATSESQVPPAAVKHRLPLQAFPPIFRTFALLQRITSCHKVRKDQPDRLVAGKTADAVCAATIRQIRQTTIRDP